MRAMINPRIVTVYDESANHISLYIYRGPKGVQRPLDHEQYRNGLKRYAHG